MRAKEHYLYNTWQLMKRRCYARACKFYGQYGGRGISVCNRWRYSFWNFVDDMGDRPDGHSLDRIDNDGNYTPANCKWSCAIEQANNKSNTVHLTIYGITHTISEWARVMEVDVKRLHKRKQLGWSDEDIILTPKLVSKNHDITYYTS